MDKIFAKPWLETIGLAQFFRCEAVKLRLDLYDIVLNADVMYFVNNVSYAHTGLAEYLKAYQLMSTGQTTEQVLSLKPGKMRSQVLREEEMWRMTKTGRNIGNTVTTKGVVLDKQQCKLCCCIHQLYNIFFPRPLMKYRM